MTIEAAKARCQKTHPGKSPAICMSTRGQLIYLLDLDLPPDLHKFLGEAIDTRIRSTRRGSGHGTSERWFG
jgi:hypothetical protein